MLNNFYDLFIAQNYKFYNINSNIYMYIIKFVQVKQLLKHKIVDTTQIYRVSKQKTRNIKIQQCNALYECSNDSIVQITNIKDKKKQLNMKK